MALPSFERFLSPLFMFLAEHPDGAKIRAAYDELAKRLELTEEDRAKLLPSETQRVYENRIGWAQHYLKRAGISTSPSRGVWALTADGVKLRAKYKSGLPDAEIEKIVRIANKIEEQTVGGAGSGSNEVAEPAKQDPRERLEAAYAELQRRTAGELLDLIRSRTPRFFELLVLEVLRKMGFGARPEDVHHVGKPGDGGIDGFISLDKLGLDKVFVQAKKFTEAAVDRSDLQAFFGALKARGGSKGVFITASTFSKPAREFAEQVGIVCIDGRELTRLMIEHGVGVSPEKTLTLVKVDGDYFDEE